MDIIELFVLLVECAVIGAGMAIGDWIIKILAVKLLNDSQQATLHDVEDEEDEDEAKKRKARQRKARPPASGSGGGCVGVVP